MLREIDGLGQESHWDLYDLQDTWQKEELRVNTRSPKTGKKLVAWTQVSPSQIENYQKCKRAWFFKSIARVPEPQKGHQALGTSFHLIMEKVPKGLSWPVRQDTNATEEEWEKAEAMAKIALPLLPAETPYTQIKREHGILLNTYEGGPLLRGYIDLAIPPGIGWPAFMVPANEAIVGDYKTLSDFRYMKTPQELAQSIQMMTYAKWAIEEWPSGLVGPDQDLPEHVRLLHMYAKTKAPYSRSSIRNESAVVTVPQINAFWDKTLDIVREMQSTATCTNSDDVEAGGALNGHCEAYGGCHYRDKCGLARESNIKTLFQIGKKPTSTPTTPSEDTMSGSSVMAKILAAREAAKGKTPDADTKPEQGQVSPEPAHAAVSSTQLTPVGREVSESVAAKVESPSTPTATGPEKSPSNSASVPESLGGGSTAAVGNSPVKGPISGLLAKMDAQGKGRPQLSGPLAQMYGKEQGYNPPASGYGGTGASADKNVSTVGELMKLASGIIPPDAPPRTQPVITTPGTPVVDPEADPVTTQESEEDESTTSTTDSSVVQPMSVGDGTNAQPGATGPTSASTQAVEGKRRGRPTKEEMAAREAAEKAHFNSLVEAEVQKRMASMPAGSYDATQERQVANQAVCDLLDANQKIRELNDLCTVLRSQADAKAAPAQEGLTLYIDCLPTKGSADVEDFFEWIRPATQAVEESNGVKDWRLIQYTSKGLLATQIREMLKLAGAPKALVIPSYASGADIALEILQPLAKRVIRPLK